MHVYLFSSELRNLALLRDISNLNRFDLLHASACTAKNVQVCLALTPLTRKTSNVQSFAFLVYNICCAICNKVQIQFHILVVIFYFKF